MLRLPSSGIGLSQNDLSFHLQQLDIYQGLLKQGFKKKEIVRYFGSKQQKNPLDATVTDERIALPASTYVLYSQTRNLLCTAEPQPPSKVPLMSSPSAGGALPVVGESLVTATGTHVPRNPANHGPHAPRQSSLLRFAQQVSSEVFTEPDKKAHLSFSPKSNITCCPRSQTYSYDRSEVHPDDAEDCNTIPVDEFQHLSLSQELVPTSIKTTRVTLRVASNLRPEAEAFTPLHLKLEHDTALSKGGPGSDVDISPLSVSLSIPSSSPLLVGQMLETTEQRSPSLPPVPHTPPNYGTALSRSRNRYLDGMFTIYDDSVPARYQPQTPADLGHGRPLDLANAAYTAPPGMIRSPILTQGQNLYGARLVSGEQSPTARAALIRDRRQREFARGAQVKGLRITRIREQRAGTRSVRPRYTDNPWRDNLAADAVGEENFEEPSVSATARGLRVISGNRRLLEDSDG